MTHPRTLVREHIARLLVRNGAWADALFVDRSAPISEDDHFPNVCIYTQSERTLEVPNDHEFKQELNVLIEVREMRRADMAAPWANIEGLPKQPAQAHNASRLLDDACEAIEGLVVAEFSRTRLVIEGVELDFEQINEINTDISHSGEGSVPYALAQIEFKLCYRKCFDAKVLDTCPLEYMLGEMRHTGCTTEGAAVPIQTRHLQPELAGVAE